VVFRGGYHGGVFYFRGHGSALNAPFEFLLGKYNDLAAVEALVERHRAELAAILVEPMQGTTGCIPADRSFLAGLRALANETGAPLILDEAPTRIWRPAGCRKFTASFPT
jgi:glutamate-1-semialdehyde 2,1-aminomutase